MNAARPALAALIGLFSVPARASDFASAAVGTTGSEFLLLDTSARGIAMGGAMTAATDDSSSIYWNPAGLARVPRLSTSFLHAQYVSNITYEAASYAQRINDTAVVGAGVRYLNGGSITQTDINGLANGTFTPYSYVAELGWGQAIDDLSDNDTDVSMGVTVRAIRTDLGLASAAGYGGDFGVQSRFFTTSIPYDLGLVVQNVGSGEKFEQVRNTLPTRVRFGGAVQPVKSVTLTAEAIAPINDAPYGAAGVEYALDFDGDMKAAGRAGFNSETWESLGFVSTLSAGVGLTLGNLSFDYAFAPMGVLGTVHRVSISFNLPSKSSRTRHREVAP